MPRRRPDPNRDGARLLDMLGAAKAVQIFVTGRTYYQYAADLMLRSAVERQVEIIGEAARGISDTFKSEHPENSLAPDHGPEASVIARIRRNRRRADLASGDGAYTAIDRANRTSGASE